MPVSDRWTMAAIAVAAYSLGAMIHEVAGGTVANFLAAALFLPFVRGGSPARRFWLRKTDGVPTPIERSWTCITAGVVCAAVFIVALGPGLRFGAGR